MPTETLTVGELIEILSKFDPSLPVWLNSLEYTVHGAELASCKGKDGVPYVYVDIG